MNIIIIEDKEKDKDKGDVDSSSNVFLNIRKTVDSDPLSLIHISEPTRPY